MYLACLPSSLLHSTHSPTNLSTDHPCCGPSNKLFSYDRKSCPCSSKRDPFSKGQSATCFHRQIDRQTYSQLHLPIPHSPVTLELNISIWCGLEGEEWPEIYLLAKRESVFTVPAIAMVFWEAELRMTDVYRCRRGRRPTTDHNGGEIATCTGVEVGKKKNWVCRKNYLAL